MLLAASHIGSGREVFLIPFTLPFVSAQTSSESPGGVVFLEWSDSLGGELYAEVEPFFTQASFDIGFGTFINVFLQFGGGVVGTIGGGVGPGPFPSRGVDISVTKGDWASSNTPSSYSLGTTFVNANGLVQVTPSFSNQSLFIEPIGFAGSAPLPDLPTNPFSASVNSPPSGGESFSYWNAYPSQANTITCMSIRFMRY